MRKPYRCRVYDGRVHHQPWSPLYRTRCYSGAPDRRVYPSLETRQICIQYNWTPYVYSDWWLPRYLRDRYS
jgi:hypothetical protein